MGIAIVCDLDLPRGQRCAVLTDRPPEPKARVGRAPQRPAGPAVLPPPMPATQRESECQDAGWEAGYDAGLRHAYAVALRAMLTLSETDTNWPLTAPRLLADAIGQDAADRIEDAELTQSGAPGAADEIDLAHRDTAALAAAKEET